MNSNAALILYMKPQVPGRLNFLFGQNENEQNIYHVEYTISGRVMDFVDSIFNQDPNGVINHNQRFSFGIYTDWQKERWEIKQ